MKSILFWLGFIFIYCPLFFGWLACHLIYERIRVHSRNKSS